LFDDRQRLSRSEKFGGLSELLMDKNRPRFGKRAQLSSYQAAQAAQLPAYQVGHLPGYLSMAAAPEQTGFVPEQDMKRQVAPLAVLVGYQD
jgi:hypothetical protein